MIANIPVVVDSGDCCLISRQALDVVTAMPERVRFFGVKDCGLVLNIGESHITAETVKKEKLNLICGLLSRSHLTVFIPTASFLFIHLSLQLVFDGIVRCCWVVRHWASLANDFGNIIHFPHFARWTDNRAVNFCRIFGVNTFYWASLVSTSRGFMMKFEADQGLSLKD